MDFKLRDPTEEESASKASQELQVDVGCSSMAPPTSEVGSYLIFHFRQVILPGRVTDAARGLSMDTIRI